MRYLAYTIGDDTQAAPPPTPEMMARMGEFMAEATAKGALVATGGLTSSAEGITVRVAPDGTFSAVDGPYTEAKELIGGWALLEVASREEAIEWAERFLRIAGAGESRLRRVPGPEDFGPPRG